MGRKRSIILASVLYFFGSLIEYISGDDSLGENTGITVLIFGRLVYGYACGFAMYGAPAYIGEMAPFQIRGVLVSLKEAFIVLGIVIVILLFYELN